MSEDDENFVASDLDGHALDADDLKAEEKKQLEEPEDTDKIVDYRIFWTKKRNKPVLTFEVINGKRKAKIELPPKEIKKLQSHVQTLVAHALRANYI